MMCTYYPVVAFIAAVLGGDPAVEGAPAAPETQLQDSGAAAGSRGPKGTEAGGDRAATGADGKRVPPLGGICLSVLWNERTRVHYAIAEDPEAEPKRDDSVVTTMRILEKKIDGRAYVGNSMYVRSDSGEILAYECLMAWIDPGREIDVRLTSRVPLWLGVERTERNASLHVGLEDHAERPREADEPRAATPSNKPDEKLKPLPHRVEPGTHHFRLRKVSRSFDIQPQTETERNRGKHLCESIPAPMLPDQSKDAGKSRKKTAPE